ncbi:ADR004Wp [Eremothecium gossypii ATCC 10895]|uniref:Dynactin subunit 5 n=1 Tax=Eremothecium gossypii (strain ATCC 10895 / CBS 109.51 / FGSC 9923 / NRRL Y-1056) TaxID=284811 RepID=Q75AB4_EREGS|nr:ADR004Wp [Eremothecium gossypii ATCC 10895]AAS51924.2 ADR004Wp [Eremothecium gossypii ATCC 10895]AEY96224.1 FADR004Wp [Eremothecium gossypii FDAG1]
MADWIETSNGNRISKKATITGSQRILIAGSCLIRENCVVEGNVRTLEKSASAISMGRFCMLGRASVVKPAVIGYKTDKNTGKSVSIHCPLVMNSYTLVKPGAQIHCKRMGSRVVVGANSILARCCTIGDVVIIEDDVVVPENCYVPSFSRVRRHSEWPGSIDITPLNDSMRQVIENWCKQEYLGMTPDYDD